MFDHAYNQPLLPAETPNTELLSAMPAPSTTDLLSLAATAAIDLDLCGARFDLMGRYAEADYAFSRAGLLRAGLAHFNRKAH
jgi:hypothetical protein